jgi:hypothetical protein
MAAEASRSLPPLSAPFTPTLDRGLFQNPCPLEGAQIFWANFELYPGSPFGILNVPLLPSVCLLVSVSSNGLMDRPVKTATRIWDKMASPHRLPDFLQRNI